MTKVSASKLIRVGSDAPHMVGLSLSFLGRVYWSW